MIAFERAKENLKISFERYKENFIPLVLGVVVSWLISSLILVPALFMIFSIPFNSPSFWVDLNTNLTLYMTNIIVAIALLVLEWVVAIMLGAGFIGMAKEALTGKSSLKTLFSVAKSRGLTAVLATILYLIVVSIPLLIPLVFLLLSITNPSFVFIGLILFVPLFFISLFIMIRLSPFMQAIVVSNVSAVESLKTSNAVVKVYFWDLMVLFFILFLISFILSIIPFIGLLISSLFTSSFMNVSLVKFYVDRTTTISEPSHQTPENLPQT